MTLCPPELWRCGDPVLLCGSGCVTVFLSSPSCCLVTTCLAVRVLIRILCPTLPSQGERFSCEWKYDGQRGQIHRMASGEVRIFSRHIADTTDKMEEAAALFRDDSPAEERLARFPRSFVLDCEIVAVQIPEEEDAALRLLPMQVRISLPESTLREI